MTLLDDIVGSESLAFLARENAHEIIDHLADAESAAEERDAATRRREVAACIELLDELESNAQKLRKLLRRAGR